MATYKVTSDRLADKNRGETVSDSDLAGANVEALIAGGHIEPVASRRTEKKDEE